MAQLKNCLTAAQRLGDQELVQVCSFYAFQLSLLSISHLCHISLSDHLSLSVLACVCGSLGSMSPVASTQPPVLPVTRSLGTSLCSGAGGQVIVEGSDTLIHPSAAFSAVFSMGCAVESTWSWLKCALTKTSYIWH
jgi:hypothetical protein